MTAPTQEHGLEGWIPFAERWPEKSPALDDPSVTTMDAVLVTNSLGALDRMGRMSHVWYGAPMQSSNGEIVVFDEADRKIRGLTHWRDAGTKPSSLCPAAGGKALEVYLVPLGVESSEHREVYTRYEGRKPPPQLGEYETLYTISQPALAPPEVVRYAWPAEATHAMELALSDALASGDHSIGQCLNIALAAAPAEMGQTDTSLRERIEDVEAANEKLRALLDDAYVARDVLSDKVYVPGAWLCPKCSLRIIASTMNALDGSMSSNNSPQQCANGCGPMWRVSERDERRDAYQTVDKLFDRATAAESERDALRDRLTAVEQRAEREAGLIRRIHEAAEPQGVLAADELPDHICDIMREHKNWQAAIRDALERAEYVVENFPTGHPGIYRGAVNNIYAGLSAALSGADAARQQQEGRP